MKFLYPLLGASLLLTTSAASPTITPRVTPTPVLRPRDDFSISIPPVSITPVSIPPVSIPSLSLDLPVNTCTPGASSYATPAANGYVPAEACNALWEYSPNFGLAVAFSVLFGILTTAHLVQAVLHRQSYCWVVVMAALWETGAYAFRALGAKNQQSSGIATVAQILVLVAPIWVNAYAYMVFARIVHFFSPDRKVWLFSPSILAFIFVTLDITSFVIQLIGGSMAGPGASPESQRKGLNLYMGGIGMQEGFVILFLGLVIKFHRDQIQAERTGRLAMGKLAGWRRLTWALYVCLLAITIRIIYRLIEFSAGLGDSNPLPKNEPLLYVLESTPMIAAIFVWNICHPGRYVYGDDAKMPPSWLSRHLCCCCARRRCKGCKTGTVGAHHHFDDGLEMQDDQGMRPLR